MNAYSGEITISDSEHPLEAATDTLVVYVGEVHASSDLNMSVWVHNYGPTSIRSDPHRWSFKGVSARSLPKIAVRGFASQQVFIPIQFPSAPAGSEQTGEIAFGFSKISHRLKVSLTWIPVLGEL
jgi:hypothetical protein